MAASRIYSETVRIDGVALLAHLYRPARDPQGLMLLFHGNSGNAEALRDFAIPLADQSGLLLVAPLFDRKRFPPVSYQRGHVTDGRGRPRPASRWTTRLVPGLVDWAQQGRGLPYWLWGFSAGAQFLSRVAAFQPLPVEPQRYVIVSPSSHVLPRLGRWPQGEAAPYGLGGIAEGADEARLQRRYLERPVTICVGGEDREATDPVLARSKAARRQGPDRLSRAIKTFDLGAMTALQWGWPFGWDMKVVPGIGHSARDMLVPATAMAIMDLPGGSAAAPDSDRRNAARVRIAGRWYDLPRKT